MSCLCAVNGIILNISEPEFIGILCSIIDTFDCNLSINNLPFDVEVSYIKFAILFPRFNDVSWTFKNKYNEIITFYNDIKINNPLYKRLEIMPIGNIEFTTKTYYLPEKFVDGFMIGYSNLGFLLNGKPTSETVDPNYRDDWKPDLTYINKTKFIGGPDHKFVNTRNFQMKIPTYLWDLPVDSIIDTTMYTEQLVSNLINLFLSKCSDKDHQLLMNGNHYLRFLQYQDKPTSDRYVYGYLQAIDNCTFESHKHTLRSGPKNKLSCEVIFGERGFFYEFPMEEWKNKDVCHIIEFE